MPNKQDALDNLETFAQARPFLRTAMAFLLHMRDLSMPGPVCYVAADHFLDQLETDLKNLLKVMPMRSAVGK